MLFNNFSDLCESLGKKLNEYEKTSCADEPTIIRFDLELNVERGRLKSFQSKDDIIASLRSLAQLLDYDFPFSLSFLIKDQGGNRELFRIYPHEKLPRWVLKDVIQGAK
jgi:hypothetical protein